jgi:selenocysteine lyase/cysteine desulfurase
LFASLIDANSTEIAIMPSTAFAITLAARNVQRMILAKGSRGKILLLQDQFESAVYPWQQICEESGGSVSLEIVPHPDPKEEDGWTKAILDRIDESILATCLPPLHWSNGALIDLEGIGAECRRHGVALIVDATQAVGIMPLSVKQIRPLFLASSVHKWIRAPTGASLVYVAQEVQSSWLPLDFHGRSRELPGGANAGASKNQMGPNGYPEKFFDDARKFDSGGKANPLIIPMVRAALEEVVRIDRATAQASLKLLMGPLVSWAEANGYTVPSEPRAYHIVGIEPPNCTVDELVEMAGKLKEMDIMVATRCGGIRVSPYLTTRCEEIQKLIAALETLKK